MSNTMPPLPENDPFATPCFYYGAVSVVWCWYEVELVVLNGYLDALGMRAGEFNGKGLVNFSFMSAASLFGSGSLSEVNKDPAKSRPYNPGGSAFNETELNIVAYSTARKNDVPTDLTGKDFIFGADQSKNLGVYRVHVACDNPMAIAAGRAYYYENKFLSFYKYQSPSLNRKVEDQIKTNDQWDIECMDADSSDASKLYSAVIDARNLTFHPANASELIDLSYDKKSGRVLGSRRNFLGMHQVAMLDKDLAARVSVKVGKGGGKTSKDGQQLINDMNQLVNGRSAIAIQKFDSPPCIAEAIPYYMDQI